MLEQIFTTTLESYTDDPTLIARYWNEITIAYQAKDRHYHNLTHLENLLYHLKAQRQRCSDWHATIFAIAYHDIVYNTLRQDNEEKSAQLAQQRLSAINIPEARIRLVYDMIMATQKHPVSENEDINLFTDADLSILGAPWEVYETYTRQIRKEYAIYPDLVYRLGRRKVLEHFLAKNTIYKTTAFVEHYELQARANLRQELNSI